MFTIIKKFTKRDWQYIIILSVILAFLSTIYYAYAWFIKPAGFDLNGTRGYGFIDSYVYFQYINQIKAGGWLIYDYFTLEGPQIGVFNIVWFLVGKFAWIFHLSAGVAYHLIRILLIPVLIASLYAFIRLIFPDQFKAKLTVFFSIFAGGVGSYFFYISTFDFARNVAQSPTDLWLTEGYLFPSIFHSPNFILTWILLFWTLGELILFTRTKKLRHVVIAGLASLVWFSFHPYYIPYLYLLGFIWFAILAIVKKITYKEFFLSLFVYGILTLPSLLYIYYFTKIDPIISLRNAENITLMTKPIHLILGYGFLLICALFAWVRIIRKKEKDSIDYLLLVWLVVVPILLYLPFQFQRRLILGWQTVLAILTVDQIEYWMKSRHKELKGLLKSKVLYGYAFLFIFGTSTLTLPFKEFASLKYITKVQPDAYTYNRTEMAQIAQYLLKNNPDRLPLLTTPSEAIYIVAYGLQRVYCCRPQETIDYDNKLVKVRDFYLNKSFDQKKFLSDNGIRYIFMPKVYDREGLGEMVFETVNYKIYKVITRSE